MPLEAQGGERTASMQQATGLEVDSRDYEIYYNVRYDTL
jgi:hypothetical protein